VASAIRTAILSASAAAAAVVGLAVHPAPLEAEDLPALPGPAPRARAAGQDPAADNARCAECHADVAAEWRGSLHQQAWHDPIFQSAYQIEPVAFCRGCHAPESDASAEPTEAAKDVGVACTTCHVQGGEVIGTSALASDGKRHAVRGDGRMATRQACASCHQFEFPRTAGQPMQDTLAEHASSDLSAVECQGCHMPVVERPDGTKYRSHDFSVIGDPDMLRQAVKVVAGRQGSTELSMSLTADRVGHAFPTGDMFRRLELRAEVLDAEGAVIASAPAVHLARIFADRRMTPGEASTTRVEIADTRVPPPGGGARLATLRFPRSTLRYTVRWTVAYQRMDHAMAASFGVDQARDEIVIARGIIPPHNESTP
jgi:hypothetical protein